MNQTLFRRGFVHNLTDRVKNKLGGIGGVIGQHNLIRGNILSKLVGDFFYRRLDQRIHSFYRFLQIDYFHGFYAVFIQRDP